MARQDPHTSDHDLVSFARPPVAEVALSVQFANNPIDIEVIGVFAREIRAEFPSSKLQPVSPTIVETFDLAPPPQGFEVRVDPPATLPRLWFESTRGDLVQLQHDRLTLNWRAASDDAAYPRYDSLRKRFENLLRTLRSVGKEASVTLNPSLVEVAYVNPVQLPVRNRTAGHPDLARLVNRVKSSSSSSFLGEPEDAQYQARWRIEENGKPIGRLHVSATPGLIPPNDTPIYMLNLIARVQSEKDSVPRTLSAMDVAHEWVVCGFRDLTTKKMHEYWKLKE